MTEIAKISSDLLDFKRNVFSQNGEDGVIEELFRRIGVEARTCCEFGAWDGMHLSNCRKLILEGWKALMIEADPNKAKVLVQTYQANPSVTCVSRLVDDDENSLGTIVKETGFPAQMDFLSVDIDGFDYEIFRGLDLRPRVICIEVNAAHSPDSSKEYPRDVAAKGIGQPMATFMKAAQAKGYVLVCYTANAFFVREDIAKQHGLTTLTPTAAYESFIRHLDQPAREWLYLVNRGLIQPRQRYHNSYLRFKALGLKASRYVPMMWLATERFAMQVAGFLRSRLS